MNRMLYGGIARWSSGTTLTLIFSAIFLLSCSNSTDPGEIIPLSTISVGYLPVSTSLPTWVIQAEQIAQRRGFDIHFQRYANSNLLLLGLLNGEIDATSVCADEPILAASGRGESGFEIYMQEILTIGRTFDAIIVRSDSDISSLKGLEGKTIACFPGSQLKAYLEIILKKAGVEVSRVKIIQLPPPNMLPSLLAYTVDACFALEPTITLGVSQGHIKIIAPSPIATYIGNGSPICAASFLISSVWADAHPALADTFVQATYEAVEMIESNYSALARYYSEFTPIPLNVSDQVVITTFATADSPHLKGLQEEVRILQAVGAIKGDVDVNQLIYRWRN